VILIMKSMLINLAGFLLAATVVGEPLLMAAETAEAQCRVVKDHKGKTTKLARKGGWAGAGAAVNAAAPGAGAAVGMAKYRKDIKAGGRRRYRALSNVGGPAALGVAAGPGGAAGYEVVAHHRWIKHHILRRKPHQQQDQLVIADVTCTTPAENVAQK
jgi:hypothetical protein